MLSESVQNTIEAQRRFFRTGTTRNVEFRQRKLEALYKTVQSMQAEIAAALKEDFEKGAVETYTTETGAILSELTYVRKKLRSWAKSRKVSTPLALWPAKSYVAPEPFGCTLIISP